MDKQKGQALVEFMLMLPFILFVLLGMTELTFAFREYMVLQDHARGFARFAGKGQDFKYGDIGGKNSRLLAVAGAMGFTESGKALRVTYITIGNDDGNAIVTKLTAINLGLAKLGLAKDVGFGDINTESMVTNHQAALIRNPNAQAITWVVVDVAIWHKPITQFFGVKPLILKSSATFRVGTIREFVEE